MNTEPEFPSENSHGRKSEVSNKPVIDADGAIKRALEFHQAGRLHAAENIYREILDSNPNHPEALHLLGVVCYQSNNNELAKSLIHRAIRLNPHSHAYYNNMGLVMEALGKFSEALCSYQKSLTLKPDHVDAYTNMGNMLKKQGKIFEALSCYQKAISLIPHDADAYANSGDILLKMGRLNDAITCYKDAIRLNPNIAKTFLNMGTAFHMQGKYKEAIICYEKCLKMYPHNLDALNNMGIAFQEQGHMSKALIWHQAALQVNRNDPTAYNCLGSVYETQGDMDTAISFYRKALRLKPDAESIHSNLLLCLHYDENCSSVEIRDESKIWWQTHGLPHANRFIHRKPSDVHRRLRIGYVSPDFREHSVCYFFLPLLAAHNRDRFEVFSYSNAIRPDQLTDRIRSLSDHWRSIVGLRHGEVADHIYHDAIDILVDLSGHTARNLLPVFAQKPAPIQVTWLGYPDTTGMPTIDYRITDGISDPEGESDKHCIENLIRLPHVFLCYSPLQDTPRIMKRDPRAPSQIRFASFNNPAKMNRRVIRLWSIILGRVPGARLLLKSKKFSDKMVKEYYFDLFLKNGVTSDRIDLVGFLPSSYDHLALYNEVDIALDPFPYNGTTTTCEALWMGKPVVTLRGNRHAARVGASIMKCVGHEELIAETEESYVALAVSLANEPDQLTGLQASLHRHIKNSPLCDAKGFASNMEYAYREMWKTWCAKRNSRNQAQQNEMRKSTE